MIDDLKKPQLRAIQYFYTDGSFEFGFGLLCLILSVYFYIETRVQGWLFVLVDFSLVLVMAGGAWLINRLIKQLKEHITWPRTGYIAYARQKGARRGWSLVLGMGIGGLAAAMAVVLVERIAVMPVLAGFLFAFVLLIIGWRARLPRFHLLAGLSAVAGMIINYSGLENFVALAVYYLVFGLVLFATGTCVLRTYLRQSPATEEEQP